MAHGLSFGGTMGTASQTFRQVLPGLTFENGPGQHTVVFLPKAELRYSRKGWSSSTWGDIHPPITRTWDLVSIEQQGESLASESFNQWSKEHASWTRLVIDHNTVSMIGDEIAVYDLAVDYRSGPLPEFRLSQDGEARYEGVLMGNGFVDDTTLHIAVDIEGESKPNTFQSKNGKTLTYRRTVLASQPSNGTHNVGQRAEAIDSEAASQEAAKSTAKDGAGDEFQLVK